MKFLSLEPFVPSGSNFEASKQLFQSSASRLTGMLVIMPVLKEMDANSSFRNLIAQSLHKIL